MVNELTYISTLYNFLMPALSEAEIEALAIELLTEQGYTHITPEQQEEERESRSDVILHQRLTAAIDRLNPDAPPALKPHAIRQVTDLCNNDWKDSNEKFYTMLREGVTEEHRKDGNTLGVQIRLIDFANPCNNDLAVCSQFTVINGRTNKRPDLVLFINGLPVVVIELKKPASEQTSIEDAFHQLQNYKQTIPALFCYNGMLVISDGLCARAGTLTAGWSRFLEWKTEDGETEASARCPQLKTLIAGMLRPEVLLELMHSYTVFERTGTPNPDSGITEARLEKKTAAYHQYYAMKKAVEATIHACSGARKAGVIWHTQGSGKSLSMLFYAGLLISHPQMKNPTIVVITDRNNLDSQLFDAFSTDTTLLRQTPQQATSRQHMRELLAVDGGGVVFSTIQKFSPDEGSEALAALSERKNIVVIADEAHRSQYGFEVKTRIRKDGVQTSYGFAKYLRDALPNASFIGFTGTPIEKEDASTRAVFGDYIDIYDIKQSEADGATVPVYYESRLADVHLPEKERTELDEEVDAIVSGKDSSEAEKAKAKWARQEAVVGAPQRIKTVIGDMLQHFAARCEIFNGKAMLVATSRRIAVDMYNEIIAAHPDWADEDINKGAVKVVMTSLSSSDPAEWEQHRTTKQEREILRRRFAAPEDPLQLVIVRDMWLTGFDAPCLNTMYVDKIMSGHNLMQAIARVNRVFKDKTGGLVVDYIGIASALQEAVANYTRNDGKGAPALELDKAVLVMLEKYDVVVNLFAGFDYKAYFDADTARKLELILDAEEHILGLDSGGGNGKERFIREVTALEKAFALVLPDARAIAIRDEVGFFQAIKSRLTKFQPGGGKSNAEIESAIRQIVNRAIVVEGIVDIFTAAGVTKQNVSVLSEEFLKEVEGMTRKNLAAELLQRLLQDEIRNKMKKNRAQGKKFSEMLLDAINKYKSNLISVTEMIETLIALAKEMRETEEKAAEMGLTDDEIAFYDALIMNDSAKEVMADEKLRELAQLLVRDVKKNATIDWTIRESVRAQLRLVVKRLLKKYGYPPDAQAIATDNILAQAELLAEEWAA